LPRSGDSGFRAIAEQSNDKLTHRGPAADQQSEFRLVVRNDATFDVDTIGQIVDAAFQFDHEPVCSCDKFDDEPVGARRLTQPLAGANQYPGGATWHPGGATWRNDALSDTD
jgi:hypothetical protein